MDKQKQDSSGSGSGMKRKHNPIQPPSPSPNSDGDEDRHGHRDRRRQPKRSVFRRLGAPREQQQQHPKQRVKDCRHWVAYGTCSFGNSCSFAHPPLRHPHHPPRTPPPQESRRKHSRPPPEPSPRRVARDNEQEDSTPTGIRSAVIVTQTSAEKSTSKLSMSRKVRLTDQKSRDPNDDLQMPSSNNPMGNTNGSNNNKYELEFESAYELEKRRQELKRRLEELNDVTSSGPGGPPPGSGGAPGGSGMIKRAPSFGPSSPQQEKKKFRHSDSKPALSARAGSRDDRDRDRDDVRERERERVDREKDRDRDRERERDQEPRGAGNTRRRPEYPSPKIDRYLDSRGDNMRERDRDRMIDQKPRGYRSVSRDDRDQRPESNIRRRGEFSPSKIDRDRYSDNRGGENLRDSGRHSAEKARPYRSLNRDDRDQRMNDNPRRRLDYSSPKIDRFSDSKGDSLRDKRPLDRPNNRPRNVQSSPMPPPRPNRAPNHKPMPLNLAPPSSTSRLALLKQRRRNLRPFRRQPPPGGAAGSREGGGGGIGSHSILSSANAVPLARRHLTGGGGRFGGKETSSMGSGGGTPRPLVSNLDGRSSRRVPLGGGGGQSHSRTGPPAFTANRSRLVNSHNNNSSSSAAYNAMNKLRKIHAKRERERKERKSLKRPADLNESSFDKSSSSRPRKRFRADSDKYPPNRDNASMDRDRADHRRIDRPRSSRDRSQRRDGGPVTPPSYRSSTRKSLDRDQKPHRQPQQSNEHFEKRDSYSSLFVNSFTNVDDSTTKLDNNNHNSHVTSKNDDLQTINSNRFEKIDKNKGSRGGTPGGAENSHRHGHHHRLDAEKLEKCDENRAKSNSHHENSGPLGIAESHPIAETNDTIEHSGPKSESETDGAAGGQDFEPISDEEVQEDANFYSAAIEALRVDWSALTKDKTFVQSKSSVPPTDENAPPPIPVDQSESSDISPLTKFKPENFLNSAGLSAKLLGPDLIAKIESSVNAKRKEKGDESIFKLDLEKDNRSKLSKNPSERLKMLNDVGPFRKALSARVDLKIRRKLCGFYSEPPDNLLLNTSEICIPFNEEAFETAKKLFLKNRQQVIQT